MQVITISASFGSAGSVVGPAVADALGVPFVDRAIPAAVADDLGIPLEDALSRDEQVQSWLARLLMAASPGATEWMIGAGPPPGVMLTDEQLLSCTQSAIRRIVADTGGVILGRAAAMVLHDHPTALHVRLDGDPDRRLRQAMRLLGISEDEARAARDRNDNARSAYVRHFYRTDAASPDHYHLVLDSTHIPPQTCVELILAAAAARTARRMPGAQTEPEAVPHPSVARIC